MAHPKVGVEATSVEWRSAPSRAWTMAFLPSLSLEWRKFGRKTLGSLRRQSVETDVVVQCDEQAVLHTD
jgi:hypothetical protein